MPHFQFSLVNIWAVPWALLRVHSRLLVEVILFRPEVTYDLSHVCIHVVEENIGGVPLGRIFMDPSVGIYHLLPDLWYHAEKPCKNGKVALYNKASALERVQGFSAQGSILALVVTLYVASLVRIIQFISRANILIDVGILGGRFWVVIPIFAIVLLWRRKQARIIGIICILLDHKGSLVEIILYLVHVGLVGIGKSKRNK